MALADEIRRQRERLARDAAPLDRIADALERLANAVEQHNARHSGQPMFVPTWSHEPGRCGVCGSEHGTMPCPALTART
jgi:hypothetical protein